MQHHSTLVHRAEDDLERLIALDGAQNFRDLGGYATADGHRVRWRRVFRSAALELVTPRDVDTIASLAVTDVFDLRTLAERSHFGAGPLGARGVRHHHVPLIAEVETAAHRAAVPAPAADRDDPRPVAAGYLSMLDEGRPTVARIFGHLADSPEGATVFHCTAGKDRTGLLAALLLSALGVDRDTIVEDYALTARHLVFDDAGAARLAAFYGTARTGPAIANPDVMALALAGVDERHGSAVGYLAAAGVTDAQLNAIAESLLED